MRNMRSMQGILALMRVSFLSAASYRVALVLSFVALLVSIVPIYFVAGALQPVVEESIRMEGGRYFDFIVVGTSAIYLISAAAGALPAALGGSLANGTFEALFVTRTPLPALLLGLVGYALSQAVIRALLLLGAGALIGVAVAWPQLPGAILIALLLVGAYFAFGLVAAALVLAFRTSGPLLAVVNSGSILLGGAYYSTTVIPAWLQDLSALVPLTYGLRAARMLLLGGANIGDVLPDVATLSLFTVTLLAIGMLAFGTALRHARRSGSLSQY
jgi:ABC-2 type transport system permease protein